MVSFHRYNPLNLNSNAFREDDPILICIWMESVWKSAGQPYYKIYPAFVNAIQGISLDVSPKHLALPVFKFGETKVLAVRFPESIVVGLEAALIIQAGSNFIILSQSSGKTWFFGAPVNMDSLGDFVESSLRENIGLSFECAQSTVRTALAICLLGSNDTEFVTRDVLFRDRDKYENADEELKRRLEDRATRRGVLGWSLGAEMETIPHIRRPHFGIRWTGQGKKIPALCSIKGSIVQKKKLTEVPTGFGEE